MIGAFPELRHARANVRFRPIADITLHGNKVPMSPSIQLLLFIPVFGVLAFIFGRNGLRGVRTGAVYERSRRYVREDEPVSFWIAVVFSLTFAAGSLVAIAFLVWTLVTLT
jgi:hypothetical protein